ncbi:MAG: M50 family metallopeptidase [Pseudomonadota bacterium]
MEMILSQGPAFILCLVFMLGLVVVVHELGHYWAGRYFGAAVESFSVGFGQPIYERKDNNGTRWRINWIPLGGFVKFVGESQLPADVGKMEAGPIGKPYGELSVGARSIVSVAGPVANFVLAVALFSLVGGFRGTHVSEVAIVDTLADRPAAEAGLQAGDILLNVNGRAIKQSADVSRAVLLTAGTEIDVEYKRDGEIETLSLVPVQIVRDNGLGQMMAQATIGVTITDVAGTIREERLNPIESLGFGVAQTGFVLDTTITMMGRLVTGKEPLGALSGPVAIGDTGRRLYNRTIGQEGVPFWAGVEVFFWNMVSISAAVSIGIGFFNLLPLPVLDGGHLVFNAYEAVTGKVLPEKVQEAALMTGLGLLMTLFVLITWGDIVETGLFGSVVG